MSKIKKISILTLLIMMPLTSCGPNNSTSDTTSEYSTSISTSENDSSINSDASSYYDGYYNSIKSWNNGADLKNQLQNLISSNINYQKYSANWTVNSLADVSQNNLDMMDQVYSDEDILIEYNAGYLPTGWNREHAFCQSLMGHYVSSSTKKIEVGSTYLLASVEIKDGQFYTTYTNGWKGYNYSFETSAGTLIIDEDVIKLDGKEVFDATLATFSVSNSSLTITQEEVSTTYTVISVQYKFASEGDGGVASDFHNLFAAASSGNSARGNKNFGSVGGTTYSGYSATTDLFEPGNEDKGRLSRAILYMDTCYGDNIELQEELATIQQVNATNIGVHGNASTIISWADSYDVTYQEYQHSQVVSNFQGNRNPYVDFPEFIDYVYGDKKDQAGTINDVLESSTQNVLHTTEKKYKNLAMSNGTYNYEVGEAFTTSDIKLYNTYTDFTKEEITDKTGIDFSIPEDYIFTDEDVGERIVTITKGKETISYKLTISERDDSQDFEFQYQATTTEFDGQKQTAKLNGIDFNIAYTGTTSTIKTSSNNLKGVQFGSKNYPISQLVIESANELVVDGKETISKINIKASAASQASISISVYVGETLVGTKTYGYTTEGYIDNNFEASEPLKGQLKIVVTNTYSKAFYIYSIAVDLD
jgi:hypothetical protein